MPVFLRSCRTGLDAEAAQLGPLAQAPLELGEPGKASQGRDIVPELDGVLSIGKPADHRAEERRAARRAEVNDGRADVPAGECQGLLAFGLYVAVPPRVVKGARQAGGQARRPRPVVTPGPAARSRDDIISFTDAA
jgi:hypothetical protein